MKKFDAFVSKFEEAVLAFSILAMAAILIGGVISRTVFNASWTFTEEVGTTLNLLVTFFAVGYCARKARHISMSIVFDLVNEKVKKVMMVFITLVTGLVMCVLCYLGVRYTLSVMQLGRVTPALRLPVWITLLPLPLGFLLAAVEYLRTFVLNVTSKSIWISSLFRLGENTDEALGLTDEPEVAKREADALKTADRQDKGGNE